MKIQIIALRLNKIITKIYFKHYLPFSNILGIGIGAIIGIVVGEQSCAYYGEHVYTYSKLIHQHHTCNWNFNEIYYMYVNFVKLYINFAFT